MNLFGQDDNLFNLYRDPAEWGYDEQSLGTFVSQTQQTKQM